MKTKLLCEELEARNTPSTWGVLDDFAASALSDPLYSQLGPGVFVNAGQVGDGGTDSGLQTSVQLADTRTVTLSSVVDDGSGGNVSVYVAGHSGPGLVYNGDWGIGATLDLDYANLSSTAAGPVTLTAPDIVLVVGDMSGGVGSDQITVSVNGTSLGTVTAPTGASESVTFNASAFVGTQINDVHVTIVAAPASDFHVSQIDASFATMPVPVPAATPMLHWHGHALGHQ